jgi:hypothetical protein
VTRYDDLTDTVRGRVGEYRRTRKRESLFADSVGALLPGPDSDVTSQVGAAVAFLRHARSDPEAINVPPRPLGRPRPQRPVTLYSWSMSQAMVSSS